MAAWDDSEDDDVVVQALAGDEAAWTWLLEKYRVYAYRLAWRITAHDEDALDAAQETLLKVARGLKGFRGRGSLRWWVTTIAIREAMTVCRRRARTPIAMDPEQLAQMCDDAPVFGARNWDPTEGLQLQQQVAWLHAGMEQLSPQQRAILMLAVTNDMGPAEIARELGLPSNQVRSQQARAIQRLRENLKDETDEQTRMQQEIRRVK